MSQFDVAIVDYGVGNVLSVKRAFEHCGASVILANSPNLIRKANKIVLPGVGAFKVAADSLRNKGLMDVIRDDVRCDKPLLGICLGMQLLFDGSEEFGYSKGFGFLKGTVVPIPPIDNLTGVRYKIPHIGWAPLIQNQYRVNEGGESFTKCSFENYVYFVHSYMANPIFKSDVVSYTRYAGLNVPAIVQSGNILGCQFHPEKSGVIGLNIIKDFLLL